MFSVPISAGSFTPGSFSVKSVIRLGIKLAVIATAETKIYIYKHFSNLSRQVSVIFEGALKKSEKLKLISQYKTFQLYFNNSIFILARYIKSTHISSY